ncbi:unnamed protein product [Ascophyllum nodosum]
MSSGLSGLLGGYGSDDSDEPRSTVASTINNNGETPREEEGPNPATSARTDLKGARKPSSGTQSNDGDSDSDSEVDDSDSDGDGNSDSDAGSEEIEKKDVDKGKALGRKRPNGGGDGGSGLLPSVDDLFRSTAGPDFLSAPGAGKEFVVKTLQKKKAEKSDLSSFSTTVSPATPGGSSNPDRESYKRERGMGAAATAVGVKKSKGGALGPAGPPVDRKAGDTDKNEKGKVTAKDRVKEQRLKGQSGIGPDFRVWKSDLEMTMRQEYD